MIVPLDRRESPKVRVGSKRNLQIIGVVRARASRVKHHRVETLAVLARVFERLADPSFDLFDMLRV